MKKKECEQEKKERKKGRMKVAGRDRQATIEIIKTGT